jgi:3D (Asp-Asp-Asp) domain-containing protein
LPSGGAYLAAMESAVQARRSEVKLSPRKIYVEVGKKANITARLSPLPTKANATFTHTWSSNDQSVATVEGSRQRPQYAASVTGVSAGRTTVKLRYQFPDNTTTEDEVTVIVIKLALTRTRVNRVTAEADPATSSSAEFTWTSLQQNIAHVDYEDATFAYSNPNSATVTSLAPGLATLRLSFRFDLDAPPIVKTINVPVFTITCYVVASEADYANNCTNLVNPHGLTGTFCQQFLMDVRLQGSGQDNNGNLIQIDYSQGNYGAGFATTYFHVVNQIRTASGRALGPNSIAVDRNYIPLGTSVEIDGLGVRSADDTGNRINGYHIDYFNGFGRAVCRGWANPAKLVQCTPGTNNCP